MTPARFIATTLAMSALLGLALTWGAVIALAAPHETREVGG